MLETENTVLFGDRIAVCLNLYLSIIGPDVRCHAILFVALDALEQLPNCPKVESNVGFNNVIYRPPILEDLS